MKHSKLVALFLLVFLSSCVTILQPLATRETIITDDRVNGTWKNQTGISIVMQRFTADIFTDDKKKLSREDSIFYSKFYLIRYTENNLNYTWFATLSRINSEYYLNLAPLNCVDKNEQDMYHIKDVESSSIAKLEWKNQNSVVLHFLNGDRIKEIILEGKARLRHEYDSMFGNFMITASSNELQEFLTKYGKNQSLFDGDKTIILNR